MIDIHTHILPEVDDGSHSLEESIEMAKIAVSDGVRVIVATPHAHDGVHKTHNPAFLAQKVNQLNAALQGNPKIALGCELRFTHDVVKHVCFDKSAPTLASGSYVLVEFPHAIVPPGSERALFELMSNDIKPIIAHPERNQSLMAEPKRFYDLVEMGALGQLDTGSIIGQFGKKVQQTARIMLENGLIHFIASDCHNTRNRLPGMSAGVGLCAEVVGPSYANAIAADNPAAVVASKLIPVRPTSTLPQKRRRWMFFGRG